MLQLYKGDNLKNRESQEDGNTTAYNGVRQSTRMRIELVVDRR
jgi:hypothetical protein